MNASDTQPNTESEQMCPALGAKFCLSESFSVSFVVVHRSLSVPIPLMQIEEEAFGAETAIESPGRESLGRERNKTMSGNVVNEK